MIIKSIYNSESWGNELSSHFVASTLAVHRFFIFFIIASLLQHTDVLFYIACLQQSNETTSKATHNKPGWDLSRYRRIEQRWRQRGPWWGWGGRVWVIRVRKHDTLVPGRICRDCFCLCVCLSASRMMDKAASLSCFCQIWMPPNIPTSLCFPAFFLLSFLGKAGKDDKPKPPHSHSLTLSPCQSEGYFRYWWHISLKTFLLFLWVFFVIIIFIWPTTNTNMFPNFNLFQFHFPVDLLHQESVKVIERTWGIRRMRMKRCIFIASPIH